MRLVEYTKDYSMKYLKREEKEIYVIEPDKVALNEYSSLGVQVWITSGSDSMKDI